MACEQAGVVRSISEKGCSSDNLAAYGFFAGFEGCGISRRGLGRRIDSRFHGRDGAMRPLAQ